MKDIFFTLMVWKQTGGKILERKDIFLTLLEWKETGAETLQIVDMFFKFNLHAMQINR